MNELAIFFFVFVLQIEQEFIVILSWLNDLHCYMTRSRKHYSVHHSLKQDSKI